MIDQQVEDVRALLSTPSGRRFMHDLVYNVCDVEGGTFYAAARDGNNQAQHQNIREGQREIAFAYMQLMKTTPDITALWVLAKEEALLQVREELKVLTIKAGKARK